MGLYDALIATYGDNVTIYCQQHIPGMNLVTIHDRYAPHVKLVDYIGLQKEALGWQRLPFRELQHYDVVFIYGNPRLLSNVAASFYLKWRRTPVVIWGQAHTATANAASEAVRLRWWHCFHNFLVYNDKESEWLKAKGFNAHNVIGMNNGLDQKKIDAASHQWPVDRLAKWQSKSGLGKNQLILSCARLVAKNRFEEAIDMLAQLVERGVDPIWAVIGDGPEKARLKKMARSKGVAERIIWVGPVYDEDKLAPWFLSADLFIHPSAIGLSLLHAMGYGLPVITHSDREKQMPEFAAFIDGGTGLLFKPGEAADFTCQTMALLTQEDRRHQMGKTAQHIARTLYNTDVMAQRFQQAAAFATSGKATVQ
mgnify:CR=1 FL=1